LYSHAQYVSPSSLVALLCDWVFEDKDAGSADTAERLSQWLSPLDAIALHAAHRSIQATGKDMAPARKSISIELDVEFRRLHNELLTSLALPGPSTTRHSHAMHPVPPGKLIGDPDFAYTRCRQHHFEQQRLMERQIDAFRRRCRQVLAHSSQRHRQLAELDIAMEHFFGERERALLSKLPALLERRFQALKAMQHSTSTTALLDSSTPPSQLNGWIATFEKNFHAALRAELAHRLDPVVGMVEAFSNET